MQVKANPEGIGQCGCGRSPNGKCIGWHGLSESEWVEGKTQLLHNFEAGRIVPPANSIVDDYIWEDED